jgi:hypothetical protein
MSTEILFDDGVKYSGEDDHDWYVGEEIEIRGRSWVVMSIGSDSFNSWQEINLEEI